MSPRTARGLLEDCLEATSGFRGPAYWPWVASLSRLLDSLILAEEAD